MTTAIDMDYLRAWVGREQRVAEILSPFPARAIAAMLDHSTLPDVGDPLAPSWHWLYFLDTPTTASTDTDGHPRKGEFLPPVPLPRRMWAAGSLDIVQPLRLGLLAEKCSTIRSVELKSGKTGALVFVGIDHQIRQNDLICVREEQTLVYRAMPHERTAPPQGGAGPMDADWSQIFEPNPVLLFRFSALTFNAHRIHYDRDYATREEFYPGLVVHAPLLATLLLDLVSHQNPGMPLSQFRFRAVHPTFDLGSVRLHGKREGNHVTLWSADHQNCVGMRASAILEETP
jgi:3-methylfumaryl-CoA hydratase